MKVRGLNSKPLLSILLNGSLEFLSRVEAIFTICHVSSWPRQQYTRNEYKTDMNVIDSIVRDVPRYWATCAYCHVRMDNMESIRATQEPAATLMSLPTELHLMISKHLTYPDALSLKHTNQHFHSLIYTGVHLKIEWLIERRRLHLDCPNDKKCELGSDMRFCRGSIGYL